MKYDLLIINLLFSSIIYMIARPTCLSLIQVPDFSFYFKGHTLTFHVKLIGKVCGTHRGWTSTHMGTMGKIPEVFLGLLLTMVNIPS
jgi:hypothetical protein